MSSESRRAREDEREQEMKITKGYQWLQTNLDYQLYLDGNPLPVLILYNETSWGVDPQRKTSRHWAAEVYGRILSCGEGGTKTRSWVYPEEAMVAARRCFRDTIVPGEARMTTRIKRKKLYA